jgi:antitoxin component of MazEF toxin-antitoxin module
MKSTELKVTRIGNSKGIRIPASTLSRYEIGDTIIMEETLEGILLRPQGPPIRKLSLAQTAERMAAAREDWNEWDATTSEGLEKTPWSEVPPRRAAEAKLDSRAKKQE